MSLLFADPDELHAIAGRISRHADGLRAVAERLSAQLGHTHWRGAAARAFHGQAGWALHSTRRAAGRLDDAADALRRIADKLAHFLTDVHRVLRATGRTAADAAQLAADLLSNPAELRRGLSQALADLGDLAGGAEHVAADVADGMLAVVGL